MHDDAGNGMTYRRWLTNRGKLDEPGAVGKIRRGLGRGLYGEPGFPYSPYSRQGEHAQGAQKCFYLGQVIFATQEARCRTREVPNG